MKQINKYSFVFLLLIQLVIFNVWILSDAVLTHGDWYYSSTYALKDLFALPYVWTLTSLGSIQSTISFYPFLLIYGGLASLGLDFSQIERAVFMWPILVLSWLGIYLLVKSMFKHEMSAIVGTIVFTFNTYFLILRTGHLTLLLAFSIAPLVILLFQKSLQKQSIKYALLTGLLGFIVSFYEFRAFYVLVWVLFVYYIYFQLILTKKTSARVLIKNSLIAVIPIILVGLLNTYWILGFVQLGTLQSNEIFSRALFGNELIDIRNSLTLFHPFWTGSRPTEFIPQKIELQYWLIPLGAITGLILQRKKNHIIFFGIITLLGILLTKQVGEPFPNLYLWLYNHLPGFNAFREASKFFFLIALGYSILIAGLVDWIWEKWSKEKKPLYGKFLITCVFVAIFLWNAKPFISGEVGSLFVPRFIPDDYRKIEIHINSEMDYYRTLLVPTNSRWSFYSQQNPQISAVNQLNSSWHKLVKEEFDQGKSNEGQLINIMMQKSAMNNLLDISSIKYVFIPLIDIKNDDDFFRYYGVEREEYINILDGLDYLKRVNMNTQEVIVYENSDYKPHIYITAEKESIEKTIAHQDVKSRLINPTEHQIIVENVQQPFYLNFSETYHPQWKIRIGDFDWIDSLIRSDYFINNSIHFMNDANLNSYYIDPEDICLKFDCILNEDGTYDMKMTLYFIPQSYVYIGGALSLTTLIVVFGVLILKFNEKNK
ncbi:MAG TPA: hypothetical protein PLS49_00060 [Candidatus Woesebacteria bacterium]|nr:hypothetical protein [Candidatus Woesebacteria bacterium]